MNKNVTFKSKNEKHHEINMEIYKLKWYRNHYLQHRIKIIAV